MEALVGEVAGAHYVWDGGSRFERECRVGSHSSTRSVAYAGPCLPSTPSHAITGLWLVPVGGYGLHLPLVCLDAGVGVNRPSPPSAPNHTLTGVRLATCDEAHVLQV